MLFNSVDFAIFLPLVFLLYWFVFNRSIETQNIFLVAASYLFYGWWDWRFLSLIIFSTLIDYIAGISIAASKDKSSRKKWLWLSICTNIGLLGFFKYYNFFIDNFITAFRFFGMPQDIATLNIILPVGISFYTFQTLSYTIDVYRGKITPVKDIWAFAAYVGFFPQLVAGPIERAANFLPQFFVSRKFNYDIAVDGSRQILWGFFKKLVIADNCAIHVNEIFAHYNDYSGGTLILGAILFSFQIYGDFSGYSDIAIGTAKLFGFNLMRNFALPYFSRDIAEFWRKWHISLSTWFRDYLYIPLGGSRQGRLVNVRNIFVIFIVSGFWHGANWTFIIWGLLHAVYFIPLYLTDRNRQNLNIVADGSYLPSLQEVLKMTGTFVLVAFAWIFFRAENLHQAFDYIERMTNYASFRLPEFVPWTSVIFILLLICIEWISRKHAHPMYQLEKVFSKVSRWLIYGSAVLIIYLFGNFSGKLEFIYFQF